MLGANERFDCIVCNALSHRVVEHFPALAEHLADAGRFIYSGFLVSEREETETRLREAGLEVVRVGTEEEWGAAETRRCRDKISRGLQNT